jgi:hypothetical protein
MRIRQMEPEFFNIVQALIHVKVGLSIAPVQIESLELGPWSEPRGQVPASPVQSKAEDAAATPKNVHVHLSSASLYSRHNRFDPVWNQQPSRTTTQIVVDVSGVTTGNLLEKKWRGLTPKCGIL